VAEVRRPGRLLAAPPDCRGNRRDHWAEPGLKTRNYSECGGYFVPRAVCHEVVDQPERSLSSADTFASIRAELDL